MTMTIDPRATLFALFALGACTDVPAPCDDDDAGTTTSPGDPLCPDDLDPGWPGEAPVDVLAFDCYQAPSDTQRVTCYVAMFLEVGHPGDLAVEVSGIGVVGWNENPWNAEAGPWENAALVGGGGGLDCGAVSINGAAVHENANGDRYFDIVLTDDSLGLYTSQRIRLTDGGPVIGG